MDNKNQPVSGNLKQPGLGIVFVLLLTGAIIGFQLGRWSNSYDRAALISPTLKACTKEAKICPDGSTVGRTGPNCEFAPCPLFIPPVSPTASGSAKAGCIKTGCSGQLCVDSSQGDMATDCEMKEEYGCLQYSQCELQKNGVCGWTQTPDYSNCLSKIKR